jgi:catechol 2,3-dioxygenase-like lactoylglutathione lyase family enzyme
MIMFKIGKLFHVTHVVDDLTAVDKWYDDVFSVTRYYRGLAKAAGREASLMAIGEVIMEPMTPAKVANLRNQSVKRFHDRFGQHFHSIAFYADDVRAISTRLGQEKLRLYDVVGRPVTPPNEAYAIWTHPRETQGQLEFAVEGDFTIDPRLQPAWSSAFWRERHPLGIERASHITFVVSDLQRAKRLYVEVLGGKLFHEQELEGNKRSAFVALGEDSVIELATPLASNTPEALDMEQNGEGVHALTFMTRDLSRATDFLKSKGMRPEADGENSVVLGRDQAFGMVIGFTRSSIPNDPR